MRPGLVFPSPGRFGFHHKIIVGCVRSAVHRHFGGAGNDQQSNEGSRDRRSDRSLPAFAAPGFGTAAALVDEASFPIVHADAWSDEFLSGARSAGDGGLRDAGAGARALRIIGSKLGVPCPRRFADRALGGHPFLDCTAPIVTLVRFHWSPPPVENLRTIRPKCLTKGKTPRGKSSLFGGKQGRCRDCTSVGQVRCPAVTPAG